MSKISQRAVKQVIEVNSKPAELKGKCVYCETTKALTKHHVNGGGKGPKVYACSFCHQVINGASQKSFERLEKRLKRRVKQDQEMLALLSEKRQVDGIFAIPSCLNAETNHESQLPPKGVNLSDCGSDQKDMKK